MNKFQTHKIKDPETGDIVRVVNQYEDGEVYKVELEKPDKWEVNWSACGSRDYETAKDYANLILLAATIAEYQTDKSFNKKQA